MRQLRKIFFYLFTLVYFTVCPLTVLYALGYVLRPGTEHGLVKTGLIYLSPTPSGASVYLGKRRYTKRTPTVLRNLLPGEYPVTLMLKGYQPWTQTISVEAEKAVMLEKILLLPTQWKRRTLVNEIFQELVPIPDNHLLVLSASPMIDDYVVYDVKAAQAWPLLPMDSSFQGAKVLSYLPLREAPSILLRVKSRDGEGVVRIELKENDDRIEELTELISEWPPWIEEDPSDKRRLFAFHEGSLQLLNVPTRTLIPHLVDHIRGDGFLNRSLYVVTEDGVLERVSRDGKNVELFNDEVGLKRLLAREKGAFRIRAFSEDFMFLWGAQGTLLLGRPVRRLVDRGVIGLAWDPQHERVLIWQAGQVGVLDYPPILTRDEMRQLGPRLRWVYTRGRHISQAWWVYQGSHILVQDDDQLLLIEFEPHSTPRVEPILQVKHNTSAMYSEETGTLCYLDRTTSQLSAIELLPKRELLSLPFPEQPFDGDRSAPSSFPSRHLQQRSGM